MLYEVATPPDDPQRHASSQPRKDVQLVARTPEKVGERRQFGGRLRVTHDRLGVGEQALGEAALLATGGPARLEVRRSVAYGHVREPVRARQLPR